MRLVLPVFASWRAAEGKEGVPHVVQPRAIPSLLHVPLQGSEHVGWTVRKYCPVAKLDA